MIVIPELNLTAPPGSVIGVIEEGLPGLAELVRCAVLTSDQPLPAVTGDFLLNHYFSTMSRVAVAGGISQVESLRRAGSSVILLSHDERLLEQCADEIWWLRDGKLKYRETIVTGIENAPAAFARLFSGENFGKLVIDVA